MYEKVLVSANFNYGIGVFCIGRWKLSFDEQKKDAMRREVSAQTSEEDLVIPGGMPVGIYMKTKGVMVLDTQKIKGEDGSEYEPALHIVKAGDYITGFNGKDINTKRTGRSSKFLLGTKSKIRYLQEGGDDSCKNGYDPV